MRVIEDARTIAIIARTVSQDEATALIEQYGRTVAAAAVVKATSEVCDQILEKLDHELGKSEHA